MRDVVHRAVADYVPSAALQGARTSAAIEAQAVIQQQQRDELSTAAETLRVVEGIASSNAAALAAQVRSRVRAYGDSRG